MRSRLEEGESDNAEGVHTEPVGDEERQTSSDTTHSSQQSTSSGDATELSEYIFSGQALEISGKKEAAFVTAAGEERVHAGDDDKKIKWYQL